MNEENVKLAKIRKSCHIGNIISTVVLVLSLFMLVVGIWGGIKVLSMGKAFDEMVTKETYNGVFSASNNSGSVSVVDVKFSSLPLDLRSDIPAVQEALDDHPLSVLYGSYILSMSVIMLAVVALVFLVRSVFAIIEKEGNPFTIHVKRRIKAILIATSVMLFLTSGTGPCILGILIAIAVNAILDYGITLQTQSDETL
jgi:hypothetical protein